MNFGDPVVLVYGYLTIAALVFITILLRVLYLSDKVPAHVSREQPAADDLARMQPARFIGNLPHKRAESRSFEKGPPPWN